ncbi:hypothetical protein F8M41_007119 [Gigaspora margarita]|uniref:Uncharacterized protein n=1 Tax=Gigaspora margarita TaxID=4874 RepID=A0A8H4A4K7_GIGMA|nr:hypothetical protein F8M41_007119 [Gigaspora margarita]
MGKVDAPSWVLEAHENLAILRRKISQAKGNTVDEAQSNLWTEIEKELDNINVKELGFDHPICSGILDVSSEPFSKISRTIFKAPSRRYLIPPNQMLMKFCEDFVRKEEEERQTKTLNTLSDVLFGKFIDSSEELIELTKHLLEVLGGGLGITKVEFILQQLESLQ